MSIVVKPEVAAERLKICKGCKFYKESTGSCGTLLIGGEVKYYRRVIRLCGCVMKLKVQFHLSSCPAGKWEPVALTQEKKAKAKAFLQSIEGHSKLDNLQVQQLYDWRAKISGEVRQTKFCSTCVVEIINELKEALSHE